MSKENQVLREVLNRVKEFSRWLEMEIKIHEVDDYREKSIQPLFNTTKQEDEIVNNNNIR